MLLLHYCISLLTASVVSFFGSNKNPGNQSGKTQKVIRVASRCLRQGLLGKTQSYTTSFQVRCDNWLTDMG